MKQVFIGLLSILLLTQCGDLPQLEHIDISQWKAGENGCDPYRNSVMDELMNQKEKLKGLSQNEIKALLGEADKHELYERSQKFFIYYLEPNEKCDNYSEGYKKAFYIRFNALDQAVDFNIQKIK